MRMKIAEKLWKELVRELHERQDVETAAFLFARSEKTNWHERLLIKEVVLLPPSAYRERGSDRISIDPVAINRLVRPARDSGLSVFSAHSHPGSRVAEFSWADDEGDRRFLPSLRSWMPGRPHGSMVVATDGHAAVRALTEEGLKRVELQVIGARLGLPTLAHENDDRFARQQLALGEHGQALLRSIRVGVVGVGGVGSLVAIQLAHLGVGRIVLIDGDRVERSNLSRIVGAKVGDVGMPKVEAIARYVRESGLPCEVTPIWGDLDDGALVELANLDVVVACVDTVTPRAMLNRLAYEDLVPVIDLGTGFRVDDEGRMCGDAGRVVVVGPGHPCLACWGHLDAEALRIEALPVEERQQLHDEGYIEGANVHQPSVVCFNTMVAGAGVTELVRMVTGFSGEVPGPDRIAFSFSSGTMRRNTLKEDASCRICRSEPLHFRETKGRAGSFLAEGP